MDKGSVSDVKDDKMPDEKSKAPKSAENEKPDWMQMNQQAGQKPSFYKKRFVPFWTRNKKRNLKIFLGVLAVVLVAAVVVGVLYVNNLLNLIGPEQSDGQKDGVEDQIYDEKDFAEIDGIKDANSLKELLKKWATNGGEKYSSRNVINVLLIGQDDGRSDSMILASVNKKTDQITLASFFRDSYTYINYKGEDRYTKVNAAYSWGGPDLLIETLENNFKIKIDHYVTVDFDNFSKAIDAVGGIYVEVQPYESDFIRRTSGYKNFPVGKNVLLNGGEALVFSRIRKSDADSDISRTRRQRQVISALIKQTKSASIGQLNNLANKILPYVKTNMPKTDILSIGTQAIASGWMNYPINAITSPSEEFRKGSRINGTDFMIIDYQAAAHELQMALYGSSNIPTGAHVSPFDLDLSSSQGSGSSSGETGGTSSNRNEKPSVNQQGSTAPREEGTTLPDESHELTIPRETQPPVTQDSTGQGVETSAPEKTTRRNSIFGF